MIARKGLRSLWLIAVLSVGIAACLEGTTTLDPTTSSNAPNETQVGVVGEQYTEVVDVLSRQGVTISGFRFVASNEEVAGAVLEVTTVGPGEVELIVSSGGPAVDQDAVPGPYDQLLDFAPSPRNRTEPVLVVTTDAGAAYKIDDLLFGHCDAVELVYRTFDDADYGRVCINEDGDIVR